jgi:hypothetical protein
MSDRIAHPFRGEEPERLPPDGDVVEVSLLLPGWQVAALETAAHDRGLTAGEMVRHLLRDFIRSVADDPSASRRFSKKAHPV